MSAATTTLARLRVGQWFSFVPAQWFGPARLTKKYRRTEIRRGKHPTFGTKFETHYIYDIEFDAAVVNPPGIEYGDPSDTKIRLLSKAETVKAKERVAHHMRHVRRRR